MSDNVLNDDELENLLLSWKKKFGEEYTNRAGNIYYKIGDMRTALNALVNTLLTIGYDQQDLRSILLSRQIQISLTPHEYDNNKLRKWRDVLDKQWKSTLNDFFPDTRIQEAKVPEPIKKPEVFLEPPKEDPTPTKKQPRQLKKEPITKPMDINGTKGFGKVMDIMTDENILAGIEEGDDE